MLKIFANKLITAIILALSISLNLKAELKVSGLPIFSFDSDQGVGGGLYLSMFNEDAEIKPYTYNLSVQGFITTKLMQSHYVKLDIPEFFFKRWRLITRTGFYSSFIENYCGQGSKSECIARKAEEQANLANLNGDDRQKFINNYYQYRYKSFYGNLNNNISIFKKPFNLSMMVNYRGKYYKHGDFKQSGPYEGSLFEKDFSGQKIDGYLSILETGLMIDERDIEAAPTSGYWAEASIRGSNFLTLSAWDFFGANAAFRFYIPFDTNKRLVLANQSIFDVVIGKNIPFLALTQIGGFIALNEVQAFGGQSIGRGIRSGRFAGRLKLIDQVEIRYQIVDFSFSGQHFSLGAGVFGDFGMVAYDYKNFSKDMTALYVGFGSGVRLSWNTNFVVRADISSSPEENFSPRFYLVFGNVF